MNAAADHNYYLFMEHDAHNEIVTVKHTEKGVRLNEVFKNEMATLDDNSKEVLEKILGYMEKKYMSMPMIMAKEIMFKS